MEYRRGAGRVNIVSAGDLAASSVPLSADESSPSARFLRPASLLLLSRSG